MASRPPNYRVLSETERGTASLSSVNSARRVTLWRTSEASSRSELVIVPYLFVAEKMLVTMSSGHGWHQTKYCPDHNRSNHTPPTPSTEIFQNPRWVGLRRKVLARWVVQAAVWSASVRKSTILRWNLRDIQALSKIWWASARCRW